MIPVYVYFLLGLRGPLISSMIYGMVYFDLAGVLLFLVLVLGRPTQVMLFFTCLNGTCWTFLPCQSSVSSTSIVTYSVWATH